MTIIPYPSGDVPLAASKALADDHLDDGLKDLLRGLLSTDYDARVRAMSLLVGFQIDEDAAEYTVVGEDEEAPLGDPSAIRLVPALVALAEIRDDAERFSLLTCAANVELNRLVEDVALPAGLESGYSDARVAALAMLGAALGAPLEQADEVLQPLLMAVATFNGQGELALGLLNGGGDLDGDDGEDGEDGPGDDAGDDKN
ncbi:MAG TPA: hypothetical protein VGF99_11165 [Myxococcota bacterium]